MSALADERDKELWIDLKTTTRISVDHGNPAADTLGKELRIPGTIQRIAKINAAAISAQLEHLRAAVQCASFRMRGARDDAAEPHFTRDFRFEGITDVPLLE